MDGKTYLEILAENDEEARQEFDPNAKDLLVTNVHEYENSVDGDDHHPDELEDQEAFQKPQGSHQQAAAPKPLDPYKDTTKLGITYDKNVFTQVLNIDSRFRANSGTNFQTTNFLFTLPRVIKNVVSLRISSLEIPNTYYTFSAVRGNTSFGITYPSAKFSVSSVTLVCTIPDGNYDNSTSGATSITAVIQSQLRNLTFGSYGSIVWTVKFDNLTGLLSIASGDGSTTELPFDLAWRVGTFSNRVHNFGLGYNLGFRLPDTEYFNKVYFIATTPLDVTDCNYLFLTLNPDWKVVIHNTTDKLQLFSFAKVIVNVPKNRTLYDNGANTLTKEYFLKQPSNITSIPVRLSDPYDQDIDLRGMDWSFSLEIKEVLNAALYETARN